MKVIAKICPRCQTPFEAKRKNQIYCTDDCRTDANNQKQTAKYHNIKDLEKDKAMGDQYKAKFLNSIRVVMVDYDENGKNEVITFEGKKFKKQLISAQFMKSLGLAFREEAAKKEGRRLGVYIPSKNAICLIAYYSSVSYQEVTYLRMEKKMVVAS